MTDPFQSNASKQGRLYEEQVIAYLVESGYIIDHVNWIEPHTLIEVDIVAVSSSGVEWWVECKGSWLSKRRNGSQRTDTVKKLIANAALLSLVPDHAMFMLVTSDLPTSSSVGGRWLELAQDAGWIDYVIGLPMVVPPTWGLY